MRRSNSRFPLGPNRDVCVNHSKWPLNHLSFRAEIRRSLLSLLLMLRFRSGYSAFNFGRTPLQRRLAAVGVIVCKTILYGTLSNTLIETTWIMLNYVCLKLKSTLSENIKINFSRLDYFFFVPFLFSSLWCIMKAEGDIYIVITLHSNISYCLNNI